MHLWVITTYVSLLALLLNLLASPEGHSAPNAAAGRASGSSSGRSLEKSTSRKRPNPDKQSPVAAKLESAKAGSSYNDKWEQNGKRCYHMRFIMKHVLSPANYKESSEQTCTTKCISSIKGYLENFKDRRKWSDKQKKSSCLQAGFCARSRTIEITQPSCLAVQAASALGMTCNMDACACTMEINLWRVKRRGPATDEFFKLVEAGSRTSLCHPSKMTQMFERQTTQWMVQHDTITIINKDVDCEDASQEMLECKCKNKSGGICHVVKPNKTPRCFLENPGPDGRCQCTANQLDYTGQCAGAEASSSEAAGFEDPWQSAPWHEIYNKLQDEL